MKTGIIKKKKELNKGFSLVELIVVIAIMAVLAGIVTTSLSTLSGRQAQKTCEKMLSVLETVRTQTMGKRTITATLYKTDSGYNIKTVATNTSSGTDESTKDYHVDGSSVTASYYCTSASVELSSIADSSWTAIDASGITIAFDRSSGALTTFATDLSSTDYSEIYLKFTQSGSDKEYVLHFYVDTGVIEEE